MGFDRTARAIKQAKQKTPYEPKTAIGTELFLPNHSGIKDYVENVENIGQVPIGAIIAWHKDFANTPSLPDNFVECNGQVIDNEKSPYHGQTVPNLNPEARTLFGFTYTGIKGGSATHSHTITVSNNGDHNHDVSNAQALIDITDTQVEIKERTTASWNATNSLRASSGTNSTGITQGAQLQGNTDNAGSHTHTATTDTPSHIPPYMTISWIIRIY